MCTNSARVVDTLECYMNDLVDSFEDFVKKSLFIISLAVGALVLMLGYILKFVTDQNYSTGAGTASSRTDGTAVNCTQLQSHNATESAEICQTSDNWNQANDNSNQASNNSGQESDNSNQANNNSKQANIQSENIRQPRSCTQTKLDANANKCSCKNDNTIKAVNENTAPMSSTPSYDEKVLINIGLSGSKSCSIRSVIRNSTARILIPSMPTSCSPNHHLSTPRTCSRYIATRSSCCSLCCTEDNDETISKD